MIHNQRRPAGDDVHVWVTALDVSDETLDRLARTLSDDERRRGEAFQFERHRRLFVARRAWLRAVLGTYLDLPPEQIRFVYGSHGKPSLAHDSDPGDLQFSLSHSNALAALAVAEARPLGLDLEALRPVSDTEQIAERLFSAAERQVLVSLPAHQRRQAFFTCWTRKQAYIKALGKGLACPLDSFDVTFLPDEPARLERVGTDMPDGRRWHLCHLTPEPGYVGAVAVLGRAVSLVARRWTGTRRR